MTDTKDIQKLKYKMTQDVFFKRCMADKLVAKEFFQKYFPQYIAKHADFSTLQMEKSDFADKTLGKGISDILYSVKWNNKKGYISLLLEHQSTSDRLMTFRIFKYMLKICDLHLIHTKQKELPLIYPFILYTGKNAYTASRSFFDLFPDPKLAKDFFTDPINVLSLRDIEDIDLRHKYHMGVVLSLMKEIHRKDIFPHIQILVPLLQLIAQENLHIVEDVLKFLLDNAKTTHKEEIVNLLVESVPEEYRGRMKTIGEQFREDGIEKGQAAIVNSMLKKNLGISEIASMTGLRVSRIQKLLKKKEV